MTVRLGLIGCGRISHAHGIAAGRIGPEKVRFVACSDVRQEAADAFARAYGCDTAYGDAAEMLAKERLDAVVLATWPSQHLEQIEMCLKAGHRFILCEKALATSGEDAVKMWDLAKEHGATIVEGFMYLHHPMIAKLNDLVANGEIGEIDWIRSSSSYYFPEVAAGDDTSRSWRFKKETGGGVPWDLACYTVNAVATYADQLPVKVSATGSFSPNYGTINRIFGTIAFAGGRTGIIESSAAATFNQALEIHATKRTLHLETVFTPPGDSVVRELTTLKPSHIHVKEHGVPSPLPLQDDLPAFYCYQAQMESFIEVLNGKAKPMPALSHSVVNVITIETMIHSMIEERVLPVDIPDRIRAAWHDDRPSSQA
ncbi:MAG: Gfo/Idh/MocA family oxidoreductase [Rhizobiaceae bacterium]|nr:Gfo/Idh/MocA family oxidoreductase [Rhizobiaceae bacterium]